MARYLRKAMWVYGDFCLGPPVNVTTYPELANAVVLAFELSPTSTVTVTDRILESSPNYGNVIQDLEVRRAAIEEAIRALKECIPALRLEHEIPNSSVPTLRSTGSIRDSEPEPDGQRAEGGSS